MKTRRQVFRGACAAAVVVGGSVSAAVLPDAEFRNGNSWLKLRVLGYEFPDATNVDDANWLIIRGECSLGGRQWTFNDPCLETWDLLRLATWLEAISDGDISQLFCQFTEPNLELQVVGENALRIIFSLESAPITNFRASERQRRFDMPISPDLVHIAKSLRSQSSFFPPKGERAGGDLARK